MWPFAIICGGEHYLKASEKENLTLSLLINNLLLSCCCVRHLSNSDGSCWECTFDFSESSFKLTMSTVLNTLKLYYCECIILETVIKGISLVFVSCTWSLITDINSEEKDVIRTVLRSRFCWWLLDFQCCCRWGHFIDVFSHSQNHRIFEIYQLIWR